MPKKGTSRYPQLLDTAWLADQYVTQGKSTEQIAAEIGCGSSSVCWRLSKAGIPLRGKYSSNWKPKTCERCGGQFTPAGPAQRFCSGECRAGTKICEQCGKEFALTVPEVAHNPIHQRRFCTSHCAAVWRHENLSHRYLNEDGYVVVVRPPTGSRGLNDNGYVRVNLGTGRHGRGRVLEHRLVMEEMLGRPLLPGENVHHKNGIKTDNRPENLELWVKHQPPGQRVTDIIEWASEMMQRYAPERLSPEFAS